MKRAVHRRYVDTAGREDLRALARCNNINGPICPPEHLTSNPREVTCGRCRRIEDSHAVARVPFSDHALRLVSRSLAAGRSEPTREEAIAMLAEARREALRLIDDPGRAQVRRVLVALGVPEIEVRDAQRAKDRTS